MLPGTVALPNFKRAGRPPYVKEHSLAGYAAYIPRFSGFANIFVDILFFVCYDAGMKACMDAKRAAAATADGAAFPDPAAAALSGRARKGKIARLPHAVREALNERLRDGLPGAEILTWLNSLRAVRDILRKRFAGTPITKENISRWRHGGYAGWLENEQTKEAIAIMLAACRNIEPAEREALTGQLALVVTARMVVELRKFDEMPEGPLKSAAWRQLVWSLVLLRRGEFYAEKLRLERDKLFPKKEAEGSPLCSQEMQERFRQTFGLGGPHWNNFTKQWEGEGAAEMTEQEEVERLVREELRRRKAALASPAQANHDNPHPDPLPQAGEGNGNREGEGARSSNGPAQANQGSTESPTDGGPAQGVGQSNQGSTESRPTEGDQSNQGAIESGLDGVSQKHPP
jgi:hypothetical protein